MTSRDGTYGRREIIYESRQKETKPDRGQSQDTTLS